MSAATQYKTKSFIGRVIPLDEQIETIKAKLNDFEEKVNHPHTECPDLILNKINFWSNVLRNLEILKRKSK